jgi:hypothetical protein
MNKQQIYATICIVLLVGILIEQYYLNDNVLDIKNKKHYKNDKCTMKNIQDEVDYIIKEKKLSIYYKMTRSCKQGLLKGCITGCIAGGFHSGIASGVLFGIASPVLVYIENYNLQNDYNEDL